MLSTHVLNALKKALRRKGISYRAAAKELHLSESSIKRLFAERSFTLTRVEKLCELAEIDLSTLIQLAESEIHQTSELTTAQEQEIVDDPRLLLVGVCLINRCTFDEILQKYDFDEVELTRIFTRLDQLDIIEHLPGNRYRLKVSHNFRWQPGGPIQRFFIQSIVKEYLSHELFAPTNHMHYVWGMLTRESAQELATRVQRLVDEYVRVAADDAHLPMSDKLTSSLLVLFREDWEPDIFKANWGRKSRVEGTAR
jgi:transcriptional regulator with XRE-family HTH domain